MCGIQIQFGLIKLVGTHKEEFLLKLKIVTGVTLKIKMISIS